MNERNLPRLAAWRHVAARVGFEVVFLRQEEGLYHLNGYATAVAAGEGWSMRYSLTIDEEWETRSVHVVGQSVKGMHEVRVEANGRGAWRVDGVHVPTLDGCADVDLEASVCTNTLPVRRLSLRIGERRDPHAVYVNAPMLGVERLEQSYRRLEDDENGNARYAYAAPAFDFEAVLVLDRFGLVLEYPGIAIRAA